MEKITQQNNRHGLSKHPLYYTWIHMCRSCYDDNYTSYRFNSNIKVCKRWLNIKNFIEDVVTKKKGMCFSRKDLTKDYGPDNWEWITIREVMQRRVTVKLTKEAVAEIRLSKKNNTLNIKYYCKKFKCSADAIYHAASGSSWN